MKVTRINKIKMPTNFIEELRWRGMLQDMTPEIEEHLNKGMASAYLGFDPTADSLHIGHLTQIMTLIHFQNAGHKPFALVGGATGIGYHIACRAAHAPRLAQLL